LKRAYRVVALGAGLVAAALLVAGCGTGGVASKGGQPDTQAGAVLFKSTCGSCHTLQAAGTTGTIGPNLDDAFAESVSEGYKQSSIENLVLDQIRLGSGQVATYTTNKKFTVQPSMPSELLKGQDAINVAAYVASVAGQNGYASTTSFASFGTDGAKIFKGAGCAGCHTLSAAGSTGTTAAMEGLSWSRFGPVVTQVTNGGSLMPAFAGKLTTAQIQAVAQYVSSSAGKK
jgi:cbb3-type cytochrome c oxidase subunit III